MLHLHRVTAWPAKGKEFIHVHCKPLRNDNKFHLRATTYAQQLCIPVDFSHLSGTSVLSKALNSSARFATPGSYEGRSNGGSDYDQSLFA